MRTQKRWYCWDCRREWAYRHEGPEDECPGCSSRRIERIEFQGLFDIHTPKAVSVNAQDDMKPPSGGKVSEIQRPPLVLVQ